MEKHELKVIHKKSGKSMVISSGLYHSNPDDYKLVDGEPGEPSKTATFTPPVSKTPVVTQNKQGEPAPNTKKTVKAPVAPVAPPKV